MPGAWEFGSDDAKKATRRRAKHAQQASKHAGSDEGDEDDEEEVRVPSRRQPRKARSPGPDDEENDAPPRRPKKTKSTDPVDDEETRPSPRRRNTRGRSPDPESDFALGTSRPTNQVGRDLASPARQETTPSEDPPEDFEEDLRRAMTLSLAEPQGRPSDDVEEDPHYLEIIQQSRKEHEAQERRKARAARKQAEDYEAEYEKALKVSERAARGSEHQTFEDELQRVLRLSQESAAEDVRRAAERMAQQKYATLSSPSWVEGNPRARDRVDRPSEDPSSAGSPAPSTKPAPNPPKPKPSRARSLFSRKKKPIISALDAVPEYAVADLPTPGPSRPRTHSGTAARPTDTQVVIRPELKAVPEATSQALVAVREPPITIEQLLAMCERAFPKDSQMDYAVEESEKSRQIELAQLDDEAGLIAAAIAASMNESEAPADITETGLDEDSRPPEYQASGMDRVIDHTRYTSSDYRREKFGSKLRITKPIWEIMGLYQQFLDFHNGVQGAIDDDPKGKGKSKERDPPLLLLPPPPTNIESSLAETSRPTLRADFAPPTAEASTNIMASVLPAYRGVAQRMQNQSVMIGQSRIPGRRPRAPPEAHMKPFGGLPIVREENEWVGEARMARGTERRLARDKGFRRSGI